MKLLLIEDYPTMRDLVAAASRLWRKLVAAGSGVEIEAVRGIGYRLKGEARP